MMDTTFTLQGYIHDWQQDVWLDEKNFIALPKYQNLWIKYRGPWIKYLPNTTIAD